MGFEALYNVLSSRPVLNKVVVLIIHFVIQFKSYSRLFSLILTTNLLLPLKQLTAYTSLLQVNSGTIETYIQDCPDPCSPW